MSICILHIGLFFVFILLSCAYNHSSKLQWFGAWVLNIIRRNHGKGLWRWLHQGTKLLVIKNKNKNKNKIKNKVLVYIELWEDLWRRFISGFILNWINASSSTFISVCSNIWNSITCTSVADRDNENWTTNFELCIHYHWMLYPYIWAKWVVEIMKIEQLILIVSVVTILVWNPNSYFILILLLFLFFFFLFINYISWVYTIHMLYMF